MMLDSTNDGIRCNDNLEASGDGAMLRGLDVIQQRPVLLKFLRQDARHAGSRQRFHAEISELARLHHPHIAEVHHLFRADEQYFMVVEDVQGDPLDSMIERCGPIPWQSALTIICQALDGLGHAHRAGVLHRDIQPSRLIVNLDGDIKLIGFAAAPAGSAQIGHFPGSLHYAAPEQIRSETVDVRSDLYAVAAVLYTLLSGRPPFDQPSDYELILAVVGEQPAPLRKDQPKIPQRLEAVVMRGLAKAPSQRFQTAEEFRSELEAILPEKYTESDWIAPGGRIAEPAAENMRLPSPGLAERTFGQAADARLRQSRPAPHPPNRWAARSMGLVLALTAAWTVTYLVDPSPQSLTEAEAPPATGAGGFAKDAIPAAPRKPAASAEEPRPAATDEPALPSGPGLTPQQPGFTAENPELLTVVDIPSLVPEASALAPSSANAQRVAAAQQPVRLERKLKARLAYSAYRPKALDGGWKIVAE